MSINHKMTTLPPIYVNIASFWKMRLSLPPGTLLGRAPQGVGGTAPSDAEVAFHYHLHFGPGWASSTGAKSWR